MQEGPNPPLAGPPFKKLSSSWVCQVGSMEVSRKAYPVIKHARHIGRLRSYLAIMLVMIGAMS